MRNRRLTRRDFLRLSAMTTAGVVAAACARATPAVVEKEVVVTKEVEKEVVKEVEKEVEKVVEVEKISERQSPMLQEMVEAGEIPPLEERLPLVPLVETQERNESPSEYIDLQIGKYGGELKVASANPNFDFLSFLGMDEPLVAGPGIQGNNIAGNVTESFTVNPTGNEFTFFLRKGLKWSDGEPVTTEDVRFTWEDVVNNEELTPRFPQYMRDENRPDGKPMELEILDDTTFRVKFEHPYGGFPMQLAITTWKGYSELVKPAHFLKNWHTKYTKLADLEDEIAKAGLAKGEWWSLFHQKDATNWDLTRVDNLDFPTLNAWMQVEHTETVTKYERNPYYFKVDAAGQQLPYIDWIRSDLVKTHDLEVLKIISGEVDYRAEGGLENLSLYKENEDKGGYDTYLMWMHRTNADPRLNLTYEDETFRSVVRDVRFRRALNMAINREEIIDTIYYGFAELPTSVPSEYDPDGANALLDEMGMDERDADGWRLAPNGEPFSITFELTDVRPDRVPVCELIVEYWKEVGVNTDMKVIEPSLLGEREMGNLTQAGFGWSHWPEMIWGGPWGELPSDVWGRLWHDWLTTGGEEGEEPPEIVKRDFYVVNRTWVAGPKERQELSEEHRQILYDNIWEMHIGAKFRDPVTIKRGLKNFPTDGYGLANNRSWELFYWEDPERRGE